MLVKLWKSSPNRVENRTYLKPPASFCGGDFEINQTPKYTVSGWSWNDEVDSISQHTSEKSTVKEFKKAVPYMTFKVEIMHNAYDIMSQL